MNNNPYNLTPKQLEFVRQYFLCGKNASAAMRNSGYKSKNPDVDGARLLVNPGIAVLIKEEETKLASQFEIKKEDIIRELQAIAFGSLGDVLDWTSDSVTLRPRDQLTDTQTRFIQAIALDRSIETTINKHANIREVPTARLRVSTMAKEKVKALDLLAKLLGFYESKANEEKPYAKILHQAILELKGNGNGNEP